MSARIAEKPYGLDVAFEKQVVTLACSNPRFYGRVGSMLDPELLRLEPSKHALRAAHAIYKDVGHGPGGGVLVIQRLRRWMADGKVTIEVIKSVAELFDAAEDAGLMDADSVLAEVAPIIQQRIRDGAVQVAIESYGRGGDLSKAVAMEEQASRIGIADTSIGVILGPESWAEVASLKDIERLPLGIVELDSQLDGGLQRGGLGIYVGASGDGKSMALAHTAGANIVQGAFVAYATLELPRAEILARIKANMTGVAINVLKQGDTKQAQARLAALAGKVGHLVVEAFTPYVTTFEDIKEWVSRVEEFSGGRKVDLLIVDYGDKVGMRTKKGDEKASDYKSGQVVFEGMRIWAEDRKSFCWTASQANRQKDSGKKKRLDLNDVADSMHKVRVADLVVTLNLKQEGEESPTILFYVGKHRTGRSRFEVGPLPTAYEVGQIVCL